MGAEKGGVPRALVLSLPGECSPCSQSGTRFQRGLKAAPHNKLSPGKEMKPLFLLLQLKKERRWREKEKRDHT